MGVPIFIPNFDIENHVFFGVPYFSKGLRTLYSLHHLRRLAAVDLLLVSRPEVDCIFQLLAAVVFPTPKARPLSLSKQGWDLGSKTSPMNSIG